MRGSIPLCRNISRDKVVKISDIKYKISDIIRWDPLRQGACLCVRVHFFILVFRASEACEFSFKKAL